MKLVIANKNYSSWSLRPWLLLTELGIPFEEVLLGFNEPSWKEKVRAYSKSGRVPLLVDGDDVVWESVAIVEHVAERFPDAGVWPTDPRARSVARSMVAEMHAGFGALRSNMPMNISLRCGGLGATEATRRDIDRVLELWQSARERFGGSGAFLFGRFSAADAFFAPVVWRFVGHEVELPDWAKAYVDVMRALPGMKAWEEAARAEDDFVAMDEPYRASADEAPHPMTPRMYRVIVPVTDLDVAVRFYQHVLETPGKSVSEGRHYFDCGGTILACLDPRRDGDPDALRPLPDHLYLSAYDLERVRARVETSQGRLSDGEVHGEPAGAIVRRPWGERSFYGFDPFGNPLCFVEAGTEFTGAR